MKTERDDFRTLWLRVLSPDGLLFEGAVSRVTLPGSQGRFMVLPQHAPLLASLTRGNLTFMPCATEVTGMWTLGTESVAGSAQAGEPDAGRGTDFSEPCEQVLVLREGFVEVRQNHVTACVEQE